MTKERRLWAMERQIERLQRDVGYLQRRSDTYSWLRVGLFLALIGGSGAAFYLVGPPLFWLTLALLGALFGAVVARHRRLDERIARYQGWLTLKGAQVARMRLAWEGIPSSALVPRPAHPFEADLDLVGERSLHCLLDTAVAPEGSQRLRAWLTTAEPERAAILRRQQVVGELIPRSLFRGRLILAARLVAEGGADRAGQLLAWLAAHRPEPSRGRWLVGLGALAALNLVLSALYLLGVLPALGLLVPYGTYALLTLSQAQQMGALFQDALALEGSLRRLRAVFDQLEGDAYRHTPHLGALCEPFRNRAQRPSRHVARVTWVVNGTGLRGNPLVWLLLNAVVPWDQYFAYRLDQCKSELAAELPRWLDVWFEVEALASLANFAYLNPSYPFPTLAGADEEPLVEARQLGHPLLPDERRVCNDFALVGAGEIALLTGSNMAGKSSFLRTAGVNLALAYAGGVVSAASLHVGLFRLFSCIKVSDSVTDGISYFYAEVRRLKALLAALDEQHPLPLFFFIDEIFRGTNNRERLQGSRAYIRALAGKQGLGLISTHDLELVRLADEVARINNYHFREEVVAGRMLFDYILRSGPCPTTNALKIMAMEGLPVGEDEAP